ncbi:MAG: hypothetical protein AAF892_01885 [Cyanobacteria bacterium P01_D01_bin.71]
MAILNRFLHFLKLLEALVEFGEFLTTPAGTTLIFCLLSYQALCLIGCNVGTAAILASTAALTVYGTADHSAN